MTRLVVFAFPITLLAQPARPTVGPIDTGRTVVRHDTTLSNGLRITLAHVGRSPKALVRVELATGEMKQCAVDVSSGRDSVGHMGGSLVVSTGSRRIDIGADVLSEFAAPTIALIAPLVRSARLDSASTIRVAANADSVGMRALREAYTPLRRTAPGCAPLGPRHTRVVVVGQFDDNVALGAITRGFGDWQNEGERVIDPVDPGSASIIAPPHLILIDRPGAKQTALLVGAPVPLEPAMRVADAILGANVVSRITMNIREAKGYTYAPASVLTTTPDSWVEFVDVGNNVAAPALSEVLAEIKRLGTEDPTTEEVEGAKRYLLGRFLVETATRTGWADVPSSNTRGLVPVTADSVRQAVAKWLAPSRLTIVAVGDTTAVELRR